ncbi:MAG: TrkH family potassium uptake protein [Donghicola eburneus]|jgi:trk system potassium uptake protein TrkH|nr:potassium transporter TrkG [Donghicola eburneus]MCI5040456.1 TrkH family potassium uptake protein [Donghicola eburneus]
MLSALAKLPLLLHLCLIAGAAMLVPAAHALVLEEFHVARTFFYAGILVFVITTFIGIAISGRTKHYSQRDQLLTLVVSFVFLPVIMAVPFQEATRTIGFLSAYFEMVSSFTTTGATLFDKAGSLSPSLHLWRSIVGWMGGLLIWIVAAATLAPMNLGGFEITGAGTVSGDQSVVHRGMGKKTQAGRVWQTAGVLAPLYAALTLGLWVLLLIAGDRPLVALCHAMGVLSTSGISPVGGTEYASSGVGGEVVLFLFLIPALSRMTFSREVLLNPERVLIDPEFKVGMLIVVCVPSLLFLRHWIGAIEVNEQANWVAGINAFWGSMFTVMSFLTTTGYESMHWEAARGWSGLPAPGVVLIGLAIIGGGVATTTGGVKLLRVYALYMHGLREMEKLVHPSSVRAIGGPGRRIHQQGAYLAWLFFMIFALSIAAIMAMLTAVGVTFEEAMVVAVAALSTTGPLAHAAAETSFSYAALGPGAKLILCFAMVLGRLEALALIAVFNPNFWRN